MGCCAVIDPQPADLGRVVVRLGDSALAIGILVASEPGHVLVQFDTQREPLAVRCEDLIFDRRDSVRAPREMTPAQRQERVERTALMARLRARIAARQKRP
jgi:hypothetical protein